MINLKPGFHMIATWSLRKKKISDRSDHSDHMKPLSSDRSDKKFYLRDRCHCDRWRVVSIRSLNLFFLAIAAITAIVAIIWKPGLIYRKNHPAFLLNCYLYALQTHRTHSCKLRLVEKRKLWKIFLLRVPLEKQETRWRRLKTLAKICKVFYTCLHE